MESFPIYLCFVLTATIGHVEMLARNQTSFLIGYISPYRNYRSNLGFQCTAAAVTMALEDYNGSLAHYEFR